MDSQALTLNLTSIFMLLFALLIYCWLVRSLLIPAFKLVIVIIVSQLIYQLGEFLGIICQDCCRMSIIVTNLARLTTGLWVTLIMYLVSRQSQNKNIILNFKGLVRNILLATNLLSGLLAVVLGFLIQIDNSKSLSCWLKPTHSQRLVYLLTFYLLSVLLVTINLYFLATILLAKKSRSQGLRFVWMGLIYILTVVFSLVARSMILDGEIDGLQELCLKTNLSLPCLYSVVMLMHPICQRTIRERMNGSSSRMSQDSFLYKDLE